jgi:hypothetical protein
MSDDSTKPAFPDFPGVDWTNADDSAAEVEGWCIVEGDDFLDLERIDEFDDEPGREPAFTSDDQALEHVQKLAAEGSPLHARALKIHEQFKDC